MKIATLNPTRAGGLPWASAALGLLLIGCPSGDDSMATASDSQTTEDDDDDSESESQSETDDESTGGSDTDSMTSGDPATGETTDTSGPPPEGLGCDIVPACDKGPFDGHIVIEDEASIEQFAGYTSTTGWLQVIDTQFACLDFLACLESVGGELEISQNPYLESVAGLNSVASAANVYIYNNEILTTLDGFDGLTEVGNVSVGEMPALVNLDSFNTVERLTETLSITQNPVLEQVSGFTSLVVIEHDINITFNAALTDLTGISGLLALGNECIITNHASLCLSEVATVCGDLQQPPAEEGPPPGNTANNQDC